MISTSKPQLLEMHGFSDASINAYCACIYIKSSDSKGNICSKLLCSKSRIAPIKSTTIPRLELCGALLWAQLMHKVNNILDVKFDRISYWTDSTIVLAWIKTTSRQWKTFVANRISEIHELTQINEWHHISSEIIQLTIFPAEIVYYL